MVAEGRGKGEVDDNHYARDRAFAVLNNPRMSERDVLQVSCCVGLRDCVGCARYVLGCVELCCQRGRCVLWD